MAGVGTAEVTVAFDAWKEGDVAPMRQSLTVAAPKANLKLEAISQRLKGELVHPNRSAALQQLQFSRDGKRLIAGDYPGGVVVLWDVASGKQLQALETGYGLRGTANYFFLSPDWQTVYVSHAKRKYERVEQDGKQLIRWTYDGDVRAWDLTSGQISKTFKHDPPRNILGMELSPDGTKIVTFEELPGVYERSAQRATSLWDVRSGHYQPLPDGLQSYGKFSPDSRLLTIDTVNQENGFLRSMNVFDTATGEVKLAVPAKDLSAWNSTAGFSPDGRLVVGNYLLFDDPKNRDKHRCWLKWREVTTGEEVASFAAEDNTTFYGIRFSSDGHILAAGSWGGEKNRLFFFSVPERKLVKTIPLGEKSPGSRLVTREPVFSPDNKWLAVITQHFPDTHGLELDALDVPQARIHLIDVTAGEIRETLVAPQGFVGSACFSPDGKTLATGGNGRVLLWDLSRPPGMNVFD